MFLSSLPDPADPVHDLSQLARALACCRFASVAAISLSAAVHSASRRITHPFDGVKLGRAFARRDHRQR
jgi:hypothetical protein